MNYDTIDLLHVILLGMEFKPRTFPDLETYSSLLAVIHKPKYNVTEQTSGGYRQNILVKSWLRTQALNEVSSFLLLKTVINCGTLCNIVQHNPVAGEVSSSSEELIVIVLLNEHVVPV